jgi:ribosomal protein S18 acetylase RimI-like enzyme
MTMPADLAARPYRSGDDQYAAHESPLLFAYGRPGTVSGRTFGDGKAIAWFAGQVPDESGATQWVIWIHPDWRGREIKGKRVGAWVLDEMAELARKHGCRCILARIDRNNERSIGLHTRLGFHFVGLDSATATYAIDL